MAMLAKWNTIKGAADWLESQVGGGHTPEIVIELGATRKLVIHAGIPSDALELPEGVPAPGLVHTPFFDGIVDFDPFNCLRIQAQGVVLLTEVECKRFTYPLSRELSITPDMLRVARTELERYAAMQKPSVRAEPATSPTSLGAIKKRQHRLGQKTSHLDAIFAVLEGSIDKTNSVVSG